MVTNGGAYKHVAENAELMTEEDIMRLADTYAGIADTYIRRMYKWLSKNDVPEYKTYQDEVNASKNMKNRSGWFFNETSNQVDDRRRMNGFDDDCLPHYHNR
tara:strand:- start:1444 stop:1749 length:306 start_codon:yes stop_codon:yes gene_type:complete